MGMNHPLQAGFTDPAHDGQRVFRALLQAIAEPGIVVSLAEIPSPAPLPSALTAALLCLADGDTAVWLDEAGDTPAVREHLGFHCACPLTRDPLAASFAVIAQPMALSGLAGFNHGSDERPDRAATLLMAVSSLTEGLMLGLTGPGIDGGRSLPVDGLPAGFIGWLADNHARFPQGVDVMLTCGNRVVCLPRTTRVIPLSSQGDASCT